MYMSTVLVTLRCYLLLCFYLFFYTFRCEERSTYDTCSSSICGPGHLYQCGYRYSVRNEEVCDKHI